MTLALRTRALCRSLAADRRGTVAIISAASLMMLVAATALAVDLGALYLEHRSAQRAVDLAALAAASDLPKAEAAARATLHANGVEELLDFRAVTGHYAPDPDVAVDRRFTAGGTPINAVAVTARKRGQLYFAHAFTGEPFEIEVSATAAALNQAMFSIGSRLLRLEGGILNALLGGLLGTTVSLSALDYQALASAEVATGPFLQALAGEVGVTAGTYNDVLTADATVGDLVGALVTTTTAGGQSDAASVLTRIVGGSGAASRSLPLTSMIDLGPLGSLDIGSTSSGLDGTLNVLGLITGAATVADGTHQATLNLTASVPGLTSLTLDVAVGESAQGSGWVAVGEPGAVVRTSQVRLRLIARVGGSGLLSGVTIRLPIFLDVAYAQARLAEVTCPAGDGADASVRIGARPGIVDARIAEVSSAIVPSFGANPGLTPARLVDTALLKITGTAHVSAAQMSEEMLTFDQDDVAAKTIKTVETTDIAQSIVSSLLGDLNLNVQVLGLGLGTPALLAQSLKTTLQAVAAPLDQAIATLLSALGLHLGEADVRVHGIRCGSAVLVR